MKLVDEPIINRLCDGRLQLRHGPIDLILEAFGSGAEVEIGYQQAIAAFRTVLSELVDELVDLRKPLQKFDIPTTVCKPASSMVRAASVHAPRYFVTPMIAVAGAVADHILASLIAGRNLSRAYVNNGGDIALHLASDANFEIGVCTNPLNHELSSTVCISSSSDIRGVATSGWRGRSHSLGIADAVTVLATNASAADVAATLIANNIDLPHHPGIQRSVATELALDSDLGDREVTVDVGELTVAEARRALAAGRRHAQDMIDAGQIIGVYAALGNEMFTLHPKFDRAADFQVDAASVKTPAEQLNYA